MGVLNTGSIFSSLFKIHERSIEIHVYTYTTNDGYAHTFYSAAVAPLMHAKVTE